MHCIFHRQPLCPRSVQLALNATHSHGTGRCPSAPEAPDPELRTRQLFWGDTKGLWHILMDPVKARAVRCAPSTVQSKLEGEEGMHRRVFMLKRWCREAMLERRLAVHMPRP